MTPADKKHEENKTSPETDPEEPDTGAADRDEAAEARADGPEVSDEVPVGEPPSDIDETAESEMVGPASEPSAVQAETDPGDVEPAAAESEAPKQSEPAVLAPPPPSPAKSGGGFWSGLLGAIVGAAIGAGTVWYFIEKRPREPDPAVSSALDQQAGDIAAQTNRVASLEDELSALKQEVASNDLAGEMDTMRTDTEGRLGGLDESLNQLGSRLDALDSRLGGLDSRLGEVGSRLDAGDARLTDLEARPIADPETANQVLRNEVADMRGEVQKATDEARAQVDTMRNELSQAAEATQAKIEAAEKRAAELEAQAKERAAAAEAEAQQAAQAAEAKAALAQIKAALDSGEPYGDSLAVLSGTGTDVPGALASPASTGVPTLAELREAFPDTARAALKASRVATSEGDPGSRVVSFLRTQTQARSLTPQEGDAPDAVLSRAEAALDGGDVTGSLAELDALPADGRAAMQDWIDKAQVRANATAAADSLSQDMN